METIHQYRFNTEEHFQLITGLVRAGVKVKRGPIISTLLISESDRSFKDASSLLAGRKIGHNVGSRFTRKEEESAPFLLMRSDWLNGYPMPVAGFGYRNKTYNLDSFCLQCGIGMRQVSPFQIKGEPKWGKKHLMQLNWVFDVFFTRPDVYRDVFAKFRCERLPVLDAAAKKELTSVVQLIPSTESVPPLDVKDRPFESCKRCGRRKFLPHVYGYFPSFLEKINGDYVQVGEWFGSGGEGRREILISQGLYREIREKHLVGVSFIPQRPI